MKFADVLIKPIVTEKATMLRENPGQVTFLVNPGANQIEIRDAIEKAFNVTVTDVNIVRRRPRNRKRQGKVVGKIPGWKKAYVMLKDGDKIDIIEGV